MDTLTSIKAFHQVVNKGSFTKAAQVLGMSVAMTSKHVSHLERLLGTKLLQRNSRSISLTSAGERYHRESCYALELLHGAAERAKGATDTPQGVLKITMPLWFANPKVAGYLTEFLEHYPEVRLDLSLSNHMADMVAEGFDLALRLSDDIKPTLIARPLGHVEFYPMASPSYLRRHGMPATPQALNDHQAVYPSYVNMDATAITHKHTGEQTLLEPRIIAHSDDTLMNAELIRAGMGVGYLPSWVVESDLEAGRLVRLLPEYHLLSVPLYATYVDRAFLGAKVRAFIDFWLQKCTNS